MSIELSHDHRSCSFVLSALTLKFDWMFKAKPQAISGISSKPKFDLLLITFTIPECAIKLKEALHTDNMACTF
jgi:hypothetical protein